MESVRGCGVGLHVVCEHGIGTGAGRAGVHWSWVTGKTRSAGATAGTVKLCQAWIACDTAHIKETRKH